MAGKTIKNQNAPSARNSKTTLLYLDPERYQLVKIIAATKGISITDTIHEGIDLLLKENSDIVKQAVKMVKTVPIKEQIQNRLNKSN